MFVLVLVSTVRKIRVEVSVVAKVSTVKYVLVFVGIKNISFCTISKIGISISICFNRNIAIHHRIVMNAHVKTLSCIGR